MYVLYEDSGKLKAETVFSESDASLQVEAASGKRSKIKRNTVLFTFEQPAASELLPEAETLSQTLDVDFLWECAPQDEFDVAQLAEEYFGHPPSTVEKTALLIALSSAPAYFHRRGRGSFRPAPPDILKAALAAIEKKRLQAEQQQRWTDALVAGQLPEEFTQVAPTLLDRPDKNSPQWKAFDAAVQTLGTTPEKLLLKLGVWPNPLALHRYRFLSANFPKGTQWPPVQLEDYGTDLPIAEVQAYSVDDSHTFEIDDALSVQATDGQTITVGIHIAVPALAITRDSEFDTMARTRMST
ncbi:MAG: RNB domain-containing ribonuclease, partial [Alcaligenaceae bacterium]|nr:RNB domain-containing ribonuclease [Alcaligenaceae bacterium]